MKEQIIKSVYQIVGSDICVDANDGELVYNVIVKFIENNKPIVLSFLNVSILTSAFLNTAIGMLYKDFSEEKIKSLVSVQDISDSDRFLLKRVVDNAKIYYKNPERIEQSVREILQED